MKLRPSKRKVSASGVGRIRDAVRPFGRLGVAADDYIGRTTEGTGREVTCESGCNACCQQLVLCSIAEALGCLLLSKLALTAERFKKLKTDLAEHVSVINDEPNLYSDGGFDMWFAHHLPCVLLLSGGTCAVYASRPLACRARVAFSTKELCEQNSDDTELLNPQVLRFAHDLINRSVSRDLRLPQILLPLPVAMTYAYTGIEQGLYTLRTVSRGLITLEDKTTDYVSVDAALAGLTQPSSE